MNRRDMITGLTVVLITLLSLVAWHAAPVAGQPVIATLTMAPGCELPRTGPFNPCARLDASQVQDRRAAPCEWLTGSQQWAAVPCHYRDANLDTTILAQP